MEVVLEELLSWEVAWWEVLHRVLCSDWTLRAMRDNIERMSHSDRGAKRSNREFMDKSRSRTWDSDSKRNCPYSLVPNNSDRLDLPEDSE